MGPSYFSLIRSEPVRRAAYHDRREECGKVQGVIESSLVQEDDISNDGWWDSLRCCLGG